MFKRLLTFLAILILLLTPWIKVNAADSGDQQLMVNNGGGLGFVAYSTGGSEPVYLLNGGEDQLWIGPDSVWLTHYDVQPNTDILDNSIEFQSQANLKFSFPDGNPETDIVAEGKLPGVVSILKGSNESEWVRGASAWGQIRYVEIYPGVDFVVRSTSEGFEWEFETRGEVDLTGLRLVLEGASGLIQNTNQVLVETSLGTVGLPTLQIRDMDTGGYAPSVERAAVADGEIALYPSEELAASSQRSYTGNLDYSTYLGGLGNDIAKDVAVDDNGNIYVTGSTPSADFPVTTGAFDTAIVGTDAFVAKIDMTVSPPELAYATFIGGSGSDSAYRMGVDGGVTYLTGETDSVDFPGAGSAATQLDAFVVALNQAGTDLVYSRLLGGSDDDKGYALAIENDNAYVTGITYSSDFPTTDTSDYVREGDVFVVKLDPSGSTSYSILKGSGDADAGHGIDVSEGLAWVTGETWAKGFTTDVVEEAAVFVMGLSATGAVDSARVFDGANDDRGFDLALDPTGLIYVTGFTMSADFPVAEGSLGGIEDAFVLVLDETTTVFSTFLGGTGIDIGQGISLDPLGDLIVAGNTSSTDFPVTADAAQASLGGGYDGFISRFDLDGEDPDPLIYASYLGGAEQDYIEEATTGVWGSVYLVGSTRSVDFPVTTDAFSQTLNGTQDTYVTKLSIFPLAGLRLMKEVINDDGGGSVSNDWTLTAAADAPFEGQNFSIPGGLGEFRGVYSDITYSLSESGLTGYDGGEWSCDGGSQIGATIALALGEQVTCTITNNDDAPSLRLVKVVSNDDGGEAVANDWTLTATAEAPFDGRNFSNPGGSGSFEVVYANAPYTLAETAESGYSTSGWVCDGGNLVGTVVTLSPGQDVTCTITNDDDTPLLKLISEVTNDDGGNAVADDWTLSATAAAPDDGRNFTGLGGSGSFEAVYAQITYELSASEIQGYNTSAWDCDGGSQVGSAISLALGDQVICTISHNDQTPQLRLVKEVTNDDGGNTLADDWSLSAAADAPFDGRNFSNLGGSGISQDVYADISYALSETDTLGYSSGSWLCDGGDLNGLTITLELGENVICTILGDDIAPTLKLVKGVINDDGGEALANDWTLFATAGVPNEDRDFRNLGGSGSYEVVYANTGYDLSESSEPGYQSGEWICDGGDLTGAEIILSLDEDVTCTITSDDDTPKLKLVKVVNNLDEGDSVPNDWTLSATAPDPEDGRNFSNFGDSGVFQDVYAGAAYVLSESEVTGYFPDEWSCDGGYLDGSTIILDLGEQVTCTITNWDNAFYPAVDIQSYTNGVDSDIGPGEYILIGDEVAWTYIIENTGGVTLTDIVVTDDVLGEVSCPENTLLSGEQMTCSVSFGTAAEGQFSNLGRVSAFSPFFDIGVSDQDQSHYFGAIPSLSLLIKINDIVEDVPPGLHLEEGDGITWTYEVTNDGNVPLINVNVTDNNGTPETDWDDILVCTIPELGIGDVDTSSCELNGVAEMGLYNNAALATGTPTGELEDVSAQAMSYYYSVFQVFVPLFCN